MVYDYASDKDMNLAREVPAEPIQERTELQLPPRIFGIAVGHPSSKT